MSRINQKPNWQSQSQEEEYETPEIKSESDIESQPNIIKNIKMNQQEVTKVMQSENEPKTAVPDSGLDMNLVISAFQEKIAQLTTELVVKEATIKQLTNILNKMRGQ